MNRNLFKLFVTIFWGAIIGYGMNIMFLPQVFWIIGVLTGAVVGYIGYDIKAGFFYFKYHLTYRFVYI